MDIEKIKDKLWEQKWRHSDNLDYTFDDLLWKLVYYWYIKKEDCDFVMDYKIEAFEDED